MSLLATWLAMMMRGGVGIDLEMTFGRGELMKREKGRMK